ncbi:MAG: IS200/IS605 family element transposase accessory protein TnpB [Firmicutes bacterium]|nr:IS200/IS605 family element transposase accessory protein TnpB [Bacillota bacterium]
MKRTFKYRLYPTKAQQTKLRQALVRCCFVYNQTLAARRQAWEQEKKSLSLFDTQKLLVCWKQEKPELKQVHSQVLQETQKRLDRAFQAFFRRVKAGEKPGYPRFRGSNGYDSLTYPQYGNGVLLNGSMLWLSKIGTIRVQLHRPLEGRIKTVTIRRTAGKWYACFSCEVVEKLLPPSQEAVGADLGLQTFATLSNGETIKRQRWMKQDAKDIARLQRKKEKYTIGSLQRRKAVIALNHAYQRSKNRRQDFLHQQSRKLVNRYGYLFFEDLDIRKMQQGNDPKINRKALNRNISDVAWRRFLQHIAYKAESAGRVLLLVNPQETTQRCSRCNSIVPKSLDERVHHCPYCGGLILDRDLNAALNILALGLQSIGTATQLRPVEAPGFSPGDVGRG